MRTFLRAHWKVVVAIVLLVLLATMTVNPGAAAPELPLAARLRAHVSATASSGHDTATPAERERAARYIESVLEAEGYAIRRHAYRAGGRMMRNIEVSVSNLAPDTRPARIFIVGAHDDDDSGTAAVLELSRLLKDMRPSQGTEVKFVFFLNEEQPWSKGEEIGGIQYGADAPALEAIGWYTLQRHGGQHRPGMEKRDAGPGSFVAFVGTQASSRLVQDALSAFRAVSDLPAHGLAAPAYVQGVTLSDRSAYHRSGHPAILIADTGFMRYPYYRMKADDGAEESPDRFDYEGTARVLEGLARTIRALAAGQQG
jgi:hypothetical protein